MGKIVCVVWDDAVTRSGYWDNDHPERFKAIETKTVGHLIKQTKSEVIVASELFADGDKRDIHTIPRQMVKKVIQLKEV